MDILIAGATGVIGRYLVNAFQEKGFQVTALTRKTSHAKRNLPSQTQICTWEDLPVLKAANFDVVINLCGHNISASRWNEEVKKQIIESRVKTSEVLINWIIKQKARPRFFCANAIGIYGTQKEDDPTSLDEDSVIDGNHPPDFLSEIGVQWQNALCPALDYGLEVTTTRFGVVLKKGEGLLHKLFWSFFLGFGSIIGTGKQVISWVHIDDVVGAYLFLLRRPEWSGTFNVTSPYPVSQAEFAKTLAKVMHRPLFLKLPAVVVQKLFGEMGDLLLLKGQRVVPKRLLELGYSFHYSNIFDALSQEFK